MQTRMQPIRTIFSKFPRIVRDLAVACRKKIILDLEGEGTELDKSLIEGISAPLTHLVRNCVDHGIENPKERLAAGKPAEGRVRLSAFHESGHVNIEIEDDGRGIDLEKVRAKAVAKSIISGEQAATMSESETLNLIFESGLSTAKEVSNISGRGMGMDVVRSSLTGIRGSIDIQSVLGQGTTVRIKVPLTLAIVPALVVSCGPQKYAIPQINLREVVCLDGEKASETVERIYETPVYRLRGRLLPLLYLSRELGLVSSPRASDLPAPGDGPLNIVVLSLDEHQFGLVVTAIHDTQEIVVKPIGNLLRGQGCFAGATIMDDGKPALILDVLRLAQRARVLTDVLDKPIFKVQDQAAVVAQDMESLLLFETPDGARMALPVESVGRLELLHACNIEKVGKRDVIQYRGKILPLINVLSLLDANRQDYPQGRDGLIPVVIHQFGDVSVGLVVGRILDITECVEERAGGPARRGVLGTRIILGHATEMIDPDALVQLADSHLTIIRPQAVPEVELNG
jgi:two-component system, chemotaxis family, sensor kinase CheA